ncbi:hypothetical protein QN277_019273 [Acacia crassicarpa]|uniref:Retrotransposon gag domain-containing protein n=1 Tax=Acacia crassicarpa TaxID=499986 RepID=A0AAE1MSD0_9FABA|nr:hypothetical protein QN277_019273 [Acacia crassicarpa]
MEKADHPPHAGHQSSHQTQTDHSRRTEDPTATMPPDPLAAIAARLNAINDLRERFDALEARNDHRAHRRGKLQRFADDSEDDSDYYRRPTRPPHAKIDFPKFEGGDPRGWLLKADKFFRYYNTPEDDKIDLASLYLEGDALDFFSWLNSQRTLRHWQDLVKALEEHFGPPEFLNPDEHLALIRQTGKVQEYRQEWARRVARVSNWPEQCLLGVFLASLNESLRS